MLNQKKHKKKREEDGIVKMNAIIKNECKTMALR